MAEADTGTSPLRHTPLDALHRRLGAKLVGFAGYEMPVQYPAGVLAEHLHTRKAAGLFDVSHMGQAVIEAGDHAAAAAALERVVPGNIAGLKPMALRYSLLLGPDGGILDDVMVTRMDRDGAIVIVLNAACKEQDLAFLTEHLSDAAKVTYLADAALLALQGPEAAAVLTRLGVDVSAMSFMQAMHAVIDDMPVLISRSGYTGEDGFELSVDGAHAEALAERLLNAPEVEPVGLGARDSLRLEAGLCLYGQDIDTETTPIEADLAFTIPKRRREAADFPGAERILGQIADGPERRRVGLAPEGRAPARAGTPILDADGRTIGAVTSGTFSPSLGAPVAMGYVDLAHANADTAVQLELRGAPRPARVAPMPFVPHRYVR